MPTLMIDGEPICEVPDYVADFLLKARKGLKPMDVQGGKAEIESTPELGRSWRDEAEFGLAREIPIGMNHKLVIEIDLKAPHRRA